MIDLEAIRKELHTSAVALHPGSKTEAHVAAWHGGVAIGTGYRLVAELELLQTENEQERAKYQRDRDLMHEDLFALLRALGEPDCARTQSPHEVFMECVRKVEQLRAQARTRPGT